MRQLSFFLAAVSLAVPLQAQETFGGAKGADLSLEAIEPDSATVTTRPAGEYPADIARFLLANGAQSAQLSPDGRTIAFTWRITGQPELWTLPVEGGQPRQLTFNTGIDGFAWTPDSHGLLYEADRNGNEQPGYFVITPDGRSEREVLPAARGDFRIFGDFAADGSFVYSSTARNGLDFDIYRATMAGDSKLVREGKYAFFAPSVSPDGRLAVVVESVGEDADNLYLLDLQTGELTTIDAPPVEQRASHSLGGFAWRPDSRSFLYSTNAGRELGALTVYDINAGRPFTLHATEGDVGNIEACGAGGLGTTFTTSRDGFDKLWLTQTSGLREVQGLPEGTYALDCKGDTLLVLVNGWATPGDLYTVDYGTGAVTRVFASNLAGLDPARLTRPQVVRYPARDGVMLQGLLYLPSGAKRGAEAPPVLFSVHGGPSSQSVANFDPVVQYHVNRGVAVFEPNVRGSTGLGRSYSALDDREKRLDSVRDLVDLLDALGRDGLVDARRAAVSGGSYGGYMVNAVLAAYPEAFDAGVSIFGVGDWITALEVASPALKASDRIEYGDITEPRWREFYRVNSPIRQADSIRVPVLYSHGVQDPRIDISETETMVKALRARGIDAPFVRIPDEGHGWRKLSNQLFYYRTEADFIEKQLGVK